MCRSHLLGYMQGKFTLVKGDRNGLGKGRWSYSSKNLRDVVLVRS